MVQFLLNLPSLPPGSPKPWFPINVVVPWVKSAVAMSLKIGKSKDSDKKFSGFLMDINTISQIDARIVLLKLFSEHWGSNFRAYNRRSDEKFRFHIADSCVGQLDRYGYAMQFHSVLHMNHMQCLSSSFNIALINRTSLAVSAQGGGATFQELPQPGVSTGEFTVTPIVSGDARDVSGVSGVPEVSGVSGVPEVSGVSGVPEVSGVSAVSAVPSVSSAPAAKAVKQHPKLFLKGLQALSDHLQKVSDELKQMRQEIGSNTYDKHT